MSKTIKCQCGHIIRFWNQKAPNNPHRFETTCPIGQKEDIEAMIQAQRDYYNTKTPDPIEPLLPYSEPKVKIVPWIETVKTVMARVGFFLVKTKGLNNK